jgi:hypothetical protein
MSASELFASADAVNKFKPRATHSVNEKATSSATKTAPSKQGPFFCLVKLFIPMAKNALLIRIPNGVCPPASP